MRIVLLVIGSVLLLLYLFLLIKGRKYSAYTERLTGKDFPMSDFYVLGFAWMDVGPFRLRGKLRSVLIRQAKILYGDKYAEYYATVCWSQVLTMVHICLCFGALLAAAMDFVFFFIVGGFCAVLFGAFFATQMKNKIAERRDSCVHELPEIVSSMALLINSGMILKEAWHRIGRSKTGVVYELMRDTSSNMENGMSEVDAIHKFGVLTDSPEIKKFTSALVQGLEKGSKELSDFLVAQSSEMWSLKKQLMLQKGEQAASKLLMPIALIFLGVLVIVIGGAVGMLI